MNRFVWSRLVCGFMMLTMLVSLHSNAAKKKQHSIYIKGFGWSVMGDFGQNQKYATYNPYASFGDTTFEKVRRATGYSVLSMGLDNHFILHQFGRDRSVSLNIYPVIGFGLTRSRILNITLPVFINFNSGAVSTYGTKKNIGYNIGIGAEYFKAGLIGISENYRIYDFEDCQYIGYSKKLTNIIHPAINFGARFFTKGGHAQELNLKYGMWATDTYDKYNELPVSEQKSSYNYWCRLSYIHYIRF